MMKLELSFTPPADVVQPGKFNFFIELKYNMFPEMIEEFGDESFPPSGMHPMETDKIDETHVEYFLELDLPYGSYEAEIYFEEIQPDGQ